MDATWAEQQLNNFGSLPWHEARSTFELGLYFLAVLAILGCLIRLGTIRTIIHDFRKMRGPLWDLRTTVDDLRDLAPLVYEEPNQIGAGCSQGGAYGPQELRRTRESHSDLWELGP